MNKEYRVHGGGEYMDGWEENVDSWRQTCREKLGQKHDCADATMMF